MRYLLPCMTRKRSEQSTDCTVSVEGEAKLLSKEHFFGPNSPFRKLTTSYIKTLKYCFLLSVNQRRIQLFVLNLPKSWNKYFSFNIIVLEKQESF